MQISWEVLEAEQFLIDLGHAELLCVLMVDFDMRNDKVMSSPHFKYESIKSIWTRASLSYMAPLSQSNSASLILEYE